MNINKAIKKEKKEHRFFLFFMGMISIILPLALVLTRCFKLFYIIYLIIIEVLILLSIISKINKYTLKYRYTNNRLMFKLGMSAKKSLIICDKVTLIHTRNCDYDLEIILITSIKFKNKYLRKVDKKFLNRYRSIRKYYDKLIKDNPDETYYFQVIKRGGLQKYLLLDIIYKNCVKAICTDESIQNIKIARGQTIIDYIN